VAEGPTTAAGVEALIRRLRDEGVSAGEQVRDRIITEARAEAERLVVEAHASADALVAAARSQAESDRNAAREAVRLAYRDALMLLRQDVESLFARYVRVAVQETMGAPPAAQALIGDIIRTAVALGAGRAVVLDVPAAVAADEALDAWLRASAGDWLRQGVEVRAGGAGALRLRFAGDAHELDLSVDTVAGILLDRLQPRYRDLFGDERG